MCIRSTSLLEGKHQQLIMPAPICNHNFFLSSSCSLLLHFQVIHWCEKSREILCCTLGGRWVVAVDNRPKNSHTKCTFANAWHVQHWLSVARNKLKEQIAQLLVEHYNGSKTKHCWCHFVGLKFIYYFMRGICTSSMPLGMYKTPTLSLFFHCQNYCFLFFYFYIIVKFNTNMQIMNSVNKWTISEHKNLDDN